jgi:hypothetical protein
MCTCVSVNGCCAINIATILSALRKLEIPNWFSIIDKFLINLIALIFSENATYPASLLDDVKPLCVLDLQKIAMLIRKIMKPVIKVIESIINY